MIEPYIHFIHFGGPLKLSESVAILCAAAVNPSKTVLLHSDQPRYSEMEEAAELVGRKDLLKQIEVRVLLDHKFPFNWRGFHVSSYQYASDVMRLEILSRFGGIYADTDYYFLYPVELLSLEGYEAAFCASSPEARMVDAPWALRGKCNTALMYSAAGSEFIRRLADRTAADLHRHVCGYHVSFSPADVLVWNPNLLSRVKVLDSTFVEGPPMEDAGFFETLTDLPAVFGIHSYRSFRWEKAALHPEDFTDPVPRNTFVHAVRLALKS